MENNELFDWSLYGAMVRHERTKLGYKNTNDLSDTIYRRTRMRVSKDVLYRIEQNRQEPTAMQFMAINLAIFNEIWPRFRADMSACPSEKWRIYNENEEMPAEWRADNLAIAYEELGFFSDSGLKCVFEQDLPDSEEVYFSVGDYLEGDSWFKVQNTDGREVLEGTVRAISGDIHICL